MSPAMKYADERTAAFRATLDRLPDEIALAIGLHVYDESTLNSSNTCICGWAVREAIAIRAGVDADQVEPPSSIYHTAERCQQCFRGTHDEWDALLMGVIERDVAPLIEEALFDRVMAAVENTSPVSRPSSLRRPRQHKGEK